MQQATRRVHTGRVLNLDIDTAQFPDGSTGPAYVIRAADQRESAFDADELERRARIETIRDVRIAPARPPDASTTR